MRVFPKSALRYTLLYLTYAFPIMCFFFSTKNKWDSVMSTIQVHTSTYEWVLLWKIGSGSRCTPCCAAFCSQPSTNAVCLERTPYRDAMLGILVRWATGGYRFGGWALNGGRALISLILWGCFGFYVWQFVWRWRGEGEGVICIAGGGVWFLRGGESDSWGEGGPPILEGRGVLQL